MRVCGRLLEVTSLTASGGYSGYRGEVFVGFEPEAPLGPGRARLRASFEGTVSRLLDEGVFA